MNLTRSLSLLVPTLLTASLAAQATWTQLTPALSPTGGASGAAAASFTDFYIFGGRYGSPSVFPLGTHLSDELWRFDGTNWTSHTSATTNPNRLEFSALAFDTGRNKLVMFGGKNTNSQSEGDTWEWDSTNGWVKKIAPPTATWPTARHYAKMVYDPIASKCIMFGGYDGSSHNNETWAWDGTTWTLLAPATKPSARSRQMMAYDLHRQVIVLYGGATSGTASGRQNDTWEWDGTTWSKIPTSFTTVGLCAAGVCYDLDRQRTVMVGGYTGSTGIRNVYEYDGNNWTDRGKLLANGVTGPYVAYVAAQQKTYMFGGFNNGGPFTSNPTFPNMSNETWCYQTPDLASFSQNLSFAGCAGSAGLPSMTAVGLPWIGKSMTLEVAPVPAASSTVLFADVIPGLTPLSLIGYPGCFLYFGAPVMASTSMVLSGTTASSNLPIPFWTSLLGLTLHFQALTFDGTVGMTPRGDAVFGRL